MGQFLSPPPNNAPVAIYNDGGGLVNAYQQAALSYKLQGRRVEIRGSCRSACLLALSVPNVCVSPAAQVKAHFAYEQDTGVIRHDITDEMLASLPVPIKNRLNGKITKGYNPNATLNYADLRELGVPDCSEKPKTTKIIASDKQNSSRKVTFNIISPADIINRVVNLIKR